jgi:hypothetical protein
MASTPTAEAKTINEKHRAHLFQFATPRLLRQDRLSGFNESLEPGQLLPDDTIDTMQQTLNLALELNTEMANMYPCQALPGSPLYRTALQNKWPLPDSHAGYGFLSYESQPLPTKHLSAAQVLQFRDEAWRKYFANPSYLSLVERKFGVEQRQNLEAMAKIKLRRRLLGD